MPEEYDVNRGGHGLGILLFSDVRSVSRFFSVARVMLWKTSQLRFFRFDFFAIFRLLRSFSFIFF
jgi:hypothetical protein